MKYQTLTQCFRSEQATHDLITGVIDTITAAEDGTDVQLDFLTKDEVGEFCRTLSEKFDRA